MKKKGFTLVELLAVIAILAILVILALPNVMGMYNASQKNAFVTELQSILSAGQTQFVNDSIQLKGNATGIAYVRISGVSNKGKSNLYENGFTQATFKELQLEGTTSIDFYLEFNLAGKVISYYATDGRFQYAYHGDDLQNGNIVARENTSSSPNCGSDPTYANNPLTALDITIPKGGATGSAINTGVVTIADATEYCPTDAKFTKIELAWGKDASSNNIITVTETDLGNGGK